MSGASRTYGDLPDSVLDFLNESEAVRFAGEYVKKYGGSDVVSSSVLHLVDQAALGNVALADIPQEISKLLDLDSKKVSDAAAELVIARILPIAELVGLDAISALKTWGVDPASYQSVKRIEAEVVNAPSEEAKSSIGAGFSDPVLQHRLELIVASYRDRVRDRAQAVAVLMRSVKTGGLEMEESAAEKVLDLVVVGGDSMVENSMIPAMAGGQETKAIVPPTDGGAKADTFTEEDEKEVRKAGDDKKEAIAVPSLITDTKAAAEKIAADAKLVFATGELKTRYEHIIDARLRDVRDGYQTREKLEASAEQGGVGLVGAQLVAVMEAVENMDAMHHKALAAEMVAKKGVHMAQKAQREQEAEGTAGREAQAMAKRYAEITGKAPTELVSPAPTRSTVVMPAVDVVARREQQIDIGKVRAAIEASKVSGPVVTPVLSAASIPTTASGRPKVEDIRFERKLAGPVEELRMLTLSDFRRLSANAAQAAQKIRDKVELVSQEGYDQRIAAIRAWRSSPLCQLYVALSREALIAGKGIAQVLSEKRAAGEETLADEELTAVVGLNGVLRF